MIRRFFLAVPALLIAFDASPAPPTPTPAASPAPSPKGAKAGSAKGIRQMTLVEAAGTGPEVERFMSAFLSEMSDRGFGNIVDARLTGRKLDELKGPEADELRKAMPAEGYLGVKAETCGIQGFQTMIPDEVELADGRRVRVTRVVQGYKVSCPVAVTLVGAADGKVLSEVKVTGENSDKLSAEDTEAEGLASEDAAKKAAKKLAAALK